MASSCPNLSLGLAPPRHPSLRRTARTLRLAVAVRPPRFLRPKLRSMLTSISVALRAVGGVRAHIQILRCISRAHSLRLSRRPRVRLLWRLLGHAHSSSCPREKNPTWSSWLIRSRQSECLRSVCLDCVTVQKRSRLASEPVSCSSYTFWLVSLGPLFLVHIRTSISCRTLILVMFMQCTAVDTHRMRTHLIISV